MEWTQIKVNCRTADLENVSAIMSMVDNSLMIEDYSDVEDNLMSVYGELIDEKILYADRTLASVSLFIPEEKSLSDALAFIKERISSSGINANIELVGVDERDWENEWKKYYHTLKVGKRIVVRPPWEEYEKKPGEVEIIMDPGMAFGTGTHETTRLCLTALEKYMKPGDRVLDVGTGSGILSIAASKLGACEVVGCDIDPVAVRVAKENVETNGCRNISVCVSDLLKNVAAAEFDLVLANIVADIIMRLLGELDAFLSPGAKVVTSGIIIGKAEDVKSAFVSHGYNLTDSLYDNDWVSFVFEK